LMNKDALQEDQHEQQIWCACTFNQRW
jgi:hypothetical protein